MRDSIMNDFRSKEVETFLEKPDIHQRWESIYRTSENEAFYEQVFNYITHVSTHRPASIGTISRKERQRCKKTSAGVEYWHISSFGTL
jgi:hypothetical protein